MGNKTEFVSKVRRVGNGVIVVPVTIRLTEDDVVEALLSMHPDGSLTWKKVDEADE